MDSSLRNTSAPLHLARNADNVAGYRLLERIGAGGYGEVWKVEAPGGLTKAMKFGYGRLADSRAARELKALNRIKEVRHPFLVSLERIEVIDGQLVIVTELADMSMKDRYDHCRATGMDGIPRDELLGYLHDAADALDYMRRHNSLQHLDIKPENLLLVGDHVKVADFGLVKGLQEVSASLVGGLTPIYAAPEVFDDRPSCHSDQYSLAIVYQEMVTGVLPFPGRTPTQLAAQHLSGRPRLSPLPVPDQPVIARALSKDPTSRFDTCREMIEHLMRPVETSTESRQASLPSEACGRVISAPASPSEATCDWSSQAQARPASDSPTPSIAQTKPFAAQPARPAANTEVRVTPMAKAAEPKLELVESPTVGAGDLSIGLRPTLFIGIGGTAIQGLSRLKSRLQTRFGSLARMPAIQTLLLDTDMKSLDQALHAENQHGSMLSQAVCMRIRRPQEYRETSGSVLQWLSRRWLYNIPRSLQTEGIRPLGRLAFVDHAEIVLHQIRNGLEKAMSVDSLQTSASASGMPIISRTPRIFVVASVSGGTGSGIIIDVGYAVRTILAEMGVSDEGLCGVLVHSTTSNPAHKDLAIANTYACLSELAHLDRRGVSYPGDASCGIPHFSSTDTAFQDLYFVHLGDDLNEQQFAKANESLADYLYLNVTTACGSMLERFRHEDPPSDGIPKVRTFGVRRIGCDLESEAVKATDALCRSVVRKWLGRGLSNNSRSMPGDTLSRDLYNSRDMDAMARNGQIEQQAEACANTLGLNVDRVLDRLVASVEEGAARTAKEQIRAWMDESLSEEQELPNQAALEEVVSRLVSRIDGLLAPPAPSNEPPASSDANLVTALAVNGRRMAGEAAISLRQWILAQLDEPTGRLPGARSSLEWFQRHLRGLQQHAGEASVALQNEIATHVRDMKQPPTDNSAGPMSWLRRGSRRRSQAELRSGLTDYFELRLRGLALERAGELFHQIVTQLRPVTDQLLQIEQRMGQLLQQFDSGVACRPEMDETELPLEDKPAFHDLVIAAFRRTLRQLIYEVEEQVQSECLSRHGGLVNLADRNTELPKVLPAALRSQAWAVTQKAVRSIDVSQFFLDAAGSQDNAAAELRTAVQEAAPKMLIDGTKAHMALIVPEGNGSAEFKTMVEQSMQPAPAIIADVDRDIVVCCEAQSTSLERVATKLMEDRPDLIAFAERVHTRVDVQWPKLGHAGT